MRKAIEALTELESPCPFEAFGTVIVNHTDTSADPNGNLVCIGVNRIKTGNPTLHGEISAINNCSAILTDQNGPYKLTGAEALKAYSELSLYTTAEACPMCASAIRYAGFAEYIYATDIVTLVKTGWSQISITSEELFQESMVLPKKTHLVGGVLSNETDPLFAWQFDVNSPCPKGCGRSDDGNSCGRLKSHGKDEL